MLSSPLPVDPEKAENFYASETARIRQADPGFRGAIEVEQSVDEQLALLEKMTIADSGAYLHGTGYDANEPAHL